MRVPPRSPISTTISPVRERREVLLPPDIKPTAIRPRLQLSGVARYPCRSILRVPTYGQDVSSSALPAPASPGAQRLRRGVVPGALGGLPEVVVVAVAWDEGEALVDTLRLVAASGRYVPAHIARRKGKNRIQVDALVGAPGKCHRSLCPGIGGR